MDNEKNRVEYVNRLEHQLKHLQTEHDKYKAIAEQWEPKFTTKPIDGDKVAFGLELGGRFVHCNVTHDYLQQVDLTSGAGTVLDALVDGLVFEQFRKVITPEFDRAQRGIKAIAGAGKW